MRFSLAAIRKLSTLLTLWLLIFFFPVQSSPALCDTISPLHLLHPHLKIYKSRRLLELYDGKALIKKYSVALGKDPVGAKRKQGDFKTPEGEYVLTRKNPKSRYTLSIAINYPNNESAEIGIIEGQISKAEYRAILRANRLGAAPPQCTKLGGDVMLHGGGVGEDWTWGCIALKDDDIRELYCALPLKTPVTIKP